MRFKITLEQVGSVSWVWAIHDATPERLGGKRGVLGMSGSGCSEFGCFATREAAFVDACRWVDAQVPMRGEA